MAALLLVSCGKWTYTSKGKPISFTFSQTAMNWTSDDVIRVNSPQASGPGGGADYTIQGNSLTPVGTQLRWGDGLHSFYAVYPAGEISGNVVSANIPSTQNAGTKGVMVAYAEAIRSQEAVNLPFQHLYTTIEFVVGTGNFDGIEVSGFRLESAGGGALAGGFKAALAAQADPAVTIDPASTSSQITVTLDPKGTNPLIMGEIMKITVIALPQALTNLTAYFTVDGQDVSLPLTDSSGNPITVQPGQTVDITALGLLTPQGTGPEPEVPVNITISIDGLVVSEYELD